MAQSFSVNPGADVNSCYEAVKNAYFSACADLRDARDVVSSFTKDRRVSESLSYKAAHDRVIAATSVVSEATKAYHVALNVVIDGAKDNEISTMIAEGLAVVRAARVSLGDSSDFDSDSE